MVRNNDSASQHIEFNLNPDEVNAALHRGGESAVIDLGEGIGTLLVADVVDCDGGQGASVTGTLLADPEGTREVVVNFNKRSWLGRALGRDVTGWMTDAPVNFSIVPKGRIK